MTRTELGWFSAYVTTLPHGLSMITGSLLRKLVEDRRDLHRRHRGLPALVPVLAAGAIRRLLERVRRQDPEDDRDAGVVGRSSDALGRAPGDLVVVPRLAADHGAEADHRVEATRGRESPRDEGDLEGAGDPCEHEVVVVDAVTAQACCGALDELR